MPEPGMSYEENVQHRWVCKTAKKREMQWPVAGYRSLNLYAHTLPNGNESGQNTPKFRDGPSDFDSRALQPEPLKPKNESCRDQWRGTGHSSSVTKNYLTVTKRGEDSPNIGDSECTWRQMSPHQPPKL